MSSSNDSSHPGFRRSGGAAYKGFQKTAVLPEDPEVTHTEPGTPMGNLMRRFWQPVCLSEELTDVPRAIRILGEDLVAFRDKSGQVGVLHRHCAHRGASLEYGIIQETGIRCCYHGFHWNIDGTLLDVPGEPGEVAQRLPGDWDAVTSQRAIARHAMENPTKEDFGVYLNRKNLRQAVRGENPHMAQDAVHARANAGKQNYVYTNNTVLDIPVQAGRDDDELVREACRKMLEIVVAGDAHEGAERDTRILNAIKDYEQSYANADAAE